MFPVAEGLVTAALTTVCNAAMIVFLLVPNFTPATLWMNWAVAGSCLASWQDSGTLPHGGTVGCRASRLREAIDW